MKSIFKILIVSVVLTSCNIEEAINKTNFSNYDIVIIDSCEYITCKHNTNFLIHKSNCNNKFHNK
jgi:hypothetical protein